MVLPNREMLPVIRRNESDQSFGHDIAGKEERQIMKAFLLNIKKKYDAIPKTLKAAVWFLFCSVMQKGISVLTTPIFTRLLTTTEYGRYNVFISWMDIIAVFVTLRLYWGVYSQGLIKFEEKKDVFSSALQGLTLVMSLGWFAFYCVTQNFWNPIFKLTFLEMSAMFLMIWATAVFSFWAAEQRVNLSYRILVIATIIVSVAKPLVGIVLVQLATDKVLARVWGLAVVELLGYTWMFIVQVKKGKKLFVKDIWVYALKFNIPLIPHYLAQVILSSSDRIMIERMVGDDKAGIYSLAYSVSMLMTLLNTALQQTINPWIYRKIKNRKFEDIHQTAYIAMALVMGANLCLILVAPEAVSIFAPGSYSEAIWIVPPVAMSAFFIFLYNLFSAVEFYYEKSNFIAISTGIAAVLNIGLNYICIKWFGYMAAGYTTLVCYIVYVAMHYSFMNRITKKDQNKKIYDTKIVIGLASVFMAVGFLLMFLYKIAVVRYSLIAIVAVLAVVFHKKLFILMKDLLAKKNSSD